MSGDASHHPCIRIVNLAPEHPFPPRAVLGGGDALTQLRLQCGLAVADPDEEGVPHSERLEDALLAELVERAPRHLDARRELATLFMKAGDARAALEHSVEAYREDPSNAALICNVGVCHLSLGDLAQAEEFLKMAIDLAPENEIAQRLAAEAPYR